MFSGDGGRDPRNILEVFGLVHALDYGKVPAYHE
jgi:hypothetical protein